jgi:HSP20 family protein
MRNDRGNRSGRKTRIFFSDRDEGAGMRFPADLSWEPPADVIVTAREVIVIVDIAGMDSDSINIMTDGSRLKVGGVRGSPCCEGRKQYHQIEIRIGRFYREIELPVPVDHGNTTARYERGMLEIRIARTDPSSRVHKVEIE